MIAGKGKNKILLLDISGVIQEKETSPFSREPDLVARVKEQLTKAARDEKVRAVLLRINSPGGTVTASDLIHHEVMEFKKQTGKKVFAVIMGIGASGGYYIAVSADKIVAHPTTITGSIGVIMLNVNLQGLLEKIGVENETIKSGDKKDMGSPLKKMTEEERVLFQEVIQALYDEFVRVVVQGRKNLTEEKVRKLADGRIYSSRQALDLGLVDQIGYLQDAFEMAKNETGLETARLVLYKRPGQYRKTIYSQVPPNAPRVNALFHFDLKEWVQLGVPKFMYLWVP